MGNKPDILKVILEHKKLEVEACRTKVSEEALAEMAKADRQRRYFMQSLSQPGPFGANIIAEVKRASPSKGIIREGLDPAVQAQAYEKGGAAAMSVLTDNKFFQGSNDDLKAARAACSLPVIRKDFIVSLYQIYEAAVMGADAILLITRTLTVEFMQRALALCKELGLDALVEVHSEEELDQAGAAGAKLVGVNNRDLKTFVTDIETTIRLHKRMTADQVAVCESGIKDRADIQRVMDAGVFNFLIGETLVRSDDPAATIRELTGAA
ncbi:Indole-3-glycerol-phosphate synthase [Desulfatibacillum aliphaticivorans]|uniref:Indole-3-glycerol phosphate synthase n=1 Tax=Desulfatibacillum aliphaticivorans TaxID=218208 RepID=B8FA40_DESAL|nr:indole-3-glycerol phosphate synthase TrpC [Desulfatibacillum aliphaticivorans]ACL03136.1 Indole-3-glycerol-phosphate synthase [Desulfatibacillum aliphaticivorans]